MTATAARLWDRLTVSPLAGVFLADRTAEEEARTAPAARLLADNVVRIGISFAVAAATAQSIIYVVSVAFLGNTWIFNVDLDAGVFTWASATATAFAGLFVCVLGFFRRPNHWVFVAAGTVIFYLSLDDQIALHERVGTWIENNVHASVRLSGDLWQVAYFPLLLFPFLAFMWLASNAATRSERRSILIGLALLVAGLFAEAIHGPIGALKSIGGARYYTEVTIEEGVELAGWIVLAAATVSFVLRCVIDRAGRETATVEPR